jgi:hypothetical protein
MLFLLAATACLSCLLPASCFLLLAACACWWLVVLLAGA